MSKVTLEDIESKIQENALNGEVFLKVEDSDIGLKCLAYLKEKSKDSEIVIFKNPMVVLTVVQIWSLGATKGVFSVTANFQRLLSEKEFVDFVDRGAILFLSKEKPPMQPQRPRYCSL
jgi:hypothetical protein